MERRKKTTEVCTIYLFWGDILKRPIPVKDRKKSVARDFSWTENYKPTFTSWLREYGENIGDKKLSEVRADFSVWNRWYRIVLTDWRKPKQKL